jgi:hypothetical protein
MLGLLAAGIAYLGWKGYQLRHHFAFTAGTVTRVSGPGRSAGDYSIIYTYEVGGKRYSNDNTYSFCPGQSRKGLGDLLVGKRFPVVYAVKDPWGGFMVLNQDYADKYHYQLPDSVRYYDTLLTCKQFAP